jgi:hypothetical protein
LNNCSCNAQRTFVIPAHLCRPGETFVILREAEDLLFSPENWQMPFAKAKQAS